jgi:hypothetical protein
MPSKGRKGQAAIEYLITYGWAIFILAAIIAIIIGSGIFSPRNSSADYSISPPQMPVNGFLMTGADDNSNTMLKINISNNFGYKIEITNIVLSYRDASMSIANINDKLSQGESRVYAFTMTGSSLGTFPAKGANARVDLKIGMINCYEPINTDCAVSVGGTSAESSVPVYIVGYVQ